MKNAAKFFVIASSALLLTMLAVGNWGVNRNVKVLRTHQPRVSVWADGSVPIPPPPTGTGLFAIPAANALLADGSVPIPPPPTGLSQPATALA